MRARCLTGRLLASSSLIALAVAASASDGLANPRDGKVVAGQAEIHDRGNGRLEIQQRSQKAAIDWRSFSIGQQEHTHFAQPGRDAVALNRVTGDDASTIAGRLSADGRIILLNQNGILFTETAQVDVAGMIASTSRLDTQDFMAGRLRFTPSGNPAAQVVNRGLITVRDGGLAALVSPWVENSGTINARFGTVVLASGEAFTADLWGDGLVRLEVAEESHIRGVSHTGAMHAEGGVVALSVAEASGLVDRAINLDGVVEATRVAQVGGRILLEGGDRGSVQVAGTLDAAGQAPTDRGGEVAIAAGRIELASSARIDVSGPAGGGEAKIGGGVRGAPPLPAKKPAREVLVAEGARIDADATMAGDGGTIVVWSDDTTRFAGAASARGGPAGGDGGLIETSGKQTLHVDGAAVDASSASGDGGSWYLDPLDVRIVDQPDDTTETFVTAASIEAALDNGTPVLIDTDGQFLPDSVEVILGGDDLAGDITVEADIRKGEGASTSLTLIAGGSIDVAAQIVSDSPEGDLDVSLQAGGDITIDSFGDEAIAAIDAENITLSSETGDIALGGFTAEQPALRSDGIIKITAGGAAPAAGGGDIDLDGFAIVGNEVGIAATGSIGEDESGRILVRPGAVQADGNVEVAMRGSVDAGGAAEIYVAENGIDSSGDVQITLDMSGAGEAFILLENDAIVAAGDIGIDSSDLFSPAFFTIGEGLNGVADGVPELRSGGDITIAARRVEIDVDDDIDDPLELAGPPAGGATLTVVSRGPAGIDRLIALEEVDGPDGASAFEAVDLTLAGDFTLALGLEGGDAIALSDSGFEQLTTAANGIDVRLVQENSNGVTLLGSIDTGEGDLTVEAAGGIDGSSNGDAPSSLVQGNNISLTSTSESVGISLDRVDATTLTTSGLVTFLQDDIVTTGSQSYGGTTVIVGPRQLFSESGDVVFNGNVEAGSEQLLPGGGPPGLEIAAGGDVRFNGAVGALAPLASLEVVAANIALGDVTTEGAQTYAGSVVLSSAFLTNGGDFLVDGPVVLTDAETTVDTTSGDGDGDISFGGPIDGADAGASSLTLRSGNGGIEAGQPIGGQVPLNVLSVDTSFVPAPPLAQNVTAVPGQPASVPIDLPGDAPPATANRTLRVSGLEDLPPGTVLSDGVTSITTPTGSDDQTFASVDALAVTPPPGTDATLFFEVQVADVDPEQVTLPSGEDLRVARFEADVSDAVTFTVTAEPPSPPPAPEPLRIPSTDPGDVSAYLNEGLHFAIPDGRPARWVDNTPIVPSAAQIRAQMAQLFRQIEPAGPGESEESKAAREQVAELEQALAATYDPWEACPEVGAVSTAWQNTPADAAFNYDPAMLPYSVDVYCGGYQLTGPARGAVRDYSGLSFVTRDFWTDRRQAATSELLREFWETFGFEE